MSVPVYPIVRYSAAVLATQTKPVTTFGKSIDRIIKRLIPTMRGAAGIGLAANQVGLALSLAVIEYVPAGRPASQREQQRRGERNLRSERVPLHAIVNPTIVTYSDEQDELTEGCLSCPGIELTVRRSVTIRVQYHTSDGSVVTNELTGFPARIYQHEIDHLNGKLILDRAHGQKALIAAYQANPEAFAPRTRKLDNGN